ARHAVPTRRRQCVIPADLRVVVRVRIDEAGADGETGRVDLALARARLAADLSQAVGVDGDVTGVCGRAAAVDDGAAADDEIVWHEGAPSQSCVPWTGSACQTFVCAQSTTDHTDRESA